MLGLYHCRRVEGVTRVCFLIWELVSHTLPPVVKESRIIWGTLKIHSPHQTKKKKKHAQLLIQKCRLSLFVSSAQVFLFFLTVSMILNGSQRWEIFPSECYCNNIAMLS